MDSDNEREESESNEWSGIVGRLIMIDVSCDMWKESNSGDKPVSIALTSCFELARRLMIEAASDLFGIALFGTVKNEGKGLENVVSFIDLAQLTVDNLKKLKEFCSDVDKIRKEWDVSSTYNFEDTLIHATRAFRVDKKMSRKIVTILSYFPEPDPSHHRNILKKASDFTELNIETIFVNVSNCEIAENSLFRQLGAIFSKKPLDEYSLPEPIMSSASIISCIYQNITKRSPASHLKMHLGNDVELGVRLFYLCKTRTKPKSVYLHRETNNLVQSKNITMRSNQSDMPILRSELRMYQTYGGRNIELSYSELIHLRKFGGKPRLQLLGFEPETSLDMSKFYLKSCAFLYPDEETVTGSTKLFLCLRDRCIKKKRVAICILTARWYSIPRLIALIPQNEVKEMGHQIQPDGFHVVFLPYIDNFKDVPVDENSECCEEKTQCMKKIIKKLRFEYNRDTFENPKLQTLYSLIEALALEETEPKDVLDTTMPETDMQNERIGNFLEEFKTLFGSFDESSGVKRSRNENGGESSRKRVAKDTQCTDIDMFKSRYQNDALNKYTVEELKQILKSYNTDLPALTGLRKKDLLIMVAEVAKNIGL